MKEELITFETAKLAKEKGFNIDCLHFYTKPNSKMFGIDEHNRYYPIKNISKKLYECSINTALNVECVYSAPTQSLLQKWLREVHNIIVIADTNMMYKNKKLTYTHYVSIYKKSSWDNLWGEIEVKTYEEALEVGLQEGLKLISNEF